MPGPLAAGTLVPHQGARQDQAGSLLPWTPQGDQAPRALGLWPPRPRSAPTALSPSRFVLEVTTLEIAPPSGPLSSERRAVPDGDAARLCWPPRSQGSARPPSSPSRRSGSPRVAP